MNPQSKFLKDLANATAHWLAYRTLSGFDLLLSESLLITPIAEFFHSRQWKVEAERDSESLFRFGTPGEINYDLLATKADEKMLFETKFLKVAKDRKVPDSQKPRLISQTQRLIKDFLKLALPEDPSYQYTALIACPSSDKISDLVDQMIADGKCVFDLDRSSGSLKVTRNQKNKKISCLTGADLKAVEAWTKSPNFENFTVEISANERQGDHRVITFSVYRERMAPAV